MTFLWHLTDDEWAWAKKAGRAKNEVTSKWEQKAGQYRNTLEADIAGMVGELGLIRWCESLGIRHADDTQDWAWDRVTDGATIEVKARSEHAHRLYGWAINKSTIDKINRGARTTKRRGKVVVWAVYDGHPLDRIWTVRLAGWATVQEVTEHAPATVQEWKARNFKINNLVLPPERVRHMDTLADLLVKYDGQMVS